MFSAHVRASASRTHCHAPEGGLVPPSAGLRIGMGDPKMLSNKSLVGPGRAWTVSILDKAKFLIIIIEQELPNSL